MPDGYVLTNCRSVQASISVKHFTNLKMYSYAIYDYLAKTLTFEYKTI